MKRFDMLLICGLTLAFIIFSLIILESHSPKVESVSEFYASMISESMKHESKDPNDPKMPPAEDENDQLTEKNEAKDNQNDNRKNWPIQGLERRNAKTEEEIIIKGITVKDYVKGLNYQSSEKANSTNCSADFQEFTNEEVLDYLTKNDQGKCQENEDIFSLNEDNTAELICRNGNIPMVYLEDPYKKTVSWKQSSSFQLEDQGYGYFKCDGQTNTFVVNRFNQKISEKSKKVMKQLASKKPISVLLLSIDSFSRKISQKFLKNTLDYLRNLSNSDSLNRTISFYDFEKFSSERVKSNLIQILFGRSDASHKKYLETIKHSGKAQKESKILSEEYSVSELYDSLGYVTYAASDIHLSRLVGEGNPIRSDYEFFDYWKTSKKNIRLFRQ